MTQIRLFRKESLGSGVYETIETDLTIGDWLVDNYKIDRTKKISRTIYEYNCEKVQEDAPGNLGE